MCHGRPSWSSSRLPARAPFLRIGTKEALRANSRTREEQQLLCQVPSSPPASSFLPRHPRISAPRRRLPFSHLAESGSVQVLHGGIVLTLKIFGDRSQPSSSV